MTDEVLQGLIAEVKTFLKITWSDERTDNEVKTLVKEADHYLKEKVGVEEISYTNDLSAKSILKEYCRYVYNYSLEYFEENFKSLIWGLILKYASNE